MQLKSNQSKFIAKVFTFSTYYITKNQISETKTIHPMQTNPKIPSNLKIFVNCKLIIAFLLMIIIEQGLSYQLCPTTKLISNPDKPLAQRISYKYTLESLKTTDNIVAILQTSLIQISPCKMKACPTNTAGNTGESFIIQTSTSNCQPYALNYSPLVENYQMINSSNPEQGIQITFLPLKKTDSTNTEILYDAVLKIKCKSSETQSATTNCTKDKTQPANRARIICQMSHQAGCPTVSQNYFWQFLARSHLAFAITIWIVSLIELFLSYFIIRITIGLYGMLTGLIVGVVTIAQGYTDFISQSDGICIMIIVLSLLIGIFYGISLLTLPRLGYVNIGLWVALVIGLLCQNAVLYLSKTLLGFYILTGILALIMIVIALLAMRFFIIVSTCFLSAFGLVRPLGFFLPGYPNQLNVAHNSPTPWQFYLYLLSIIIITILGSVFQFCILKKKGRGKANQGYYLQQDSPIREKLKKLMQFQQIKKLAQAGKNEVLFFKDLLVQKKDSQESSPTKKMLDDDNYIEMQKIQPEEASYVSSKKKNRVHYQKKVSQEEQSQPQKEVKPKKKSKRTKKDEDDGENF